ncbi:hypothetical protein [Brevundimonas lenta]|uniref:Lipoprotein n=1 Tax=Brevundimonas lenta TaxID=424796 RepID=A0A7W6NPZ9_9CAUL|nr:hypothetical protein [Brevundimonas lenta]MBB4083940.1 hypothetical protein [Brevundimonas lenta]
MADWRKLGAILCAGATLGGCTSDPAFWDNVAYGMDVLSEELANQPVCNWYTDAYGVVRQHCEPAYMANQPVYVDPGHHYRDDDRRRDRREDRRRDRDRDRDGRKDRKN